MEWYIRFITIVGCDQPLLGEPDNPTARQPDCPTTRLPDSPTALIIVSDGHLLFTHGRVPRTVEVRFAKRSSFLRLLDFSFRISMSVVTSSISPG
jgi:hypothetical protein